jgi:hypothetical protein
MAKKKRQKRVQKTPPPVKTAPADFLKSIFESRYYLLYYAIFIFVLTVILFNEFVFSGKMLFSSDFINASCYFREFWKDHYHFPMGIPLWSPMIFGGMPFVDAFHADIFYPLTWPLKYLMPIPRAFGWAMFLHVFLAGLFMYLCARAFKLSKLASSLAGIFYMFAPYLVSLVQPGHDGKMFVTALFPLTMLFLERAMNDGKFLDFTLLGAIIGLIILSPHPQMSYFMLWAVGFYFGYRIILKIINKRSIIPAIKPSVLFVMAIVLGLTLSAIQFIPSYRYVKEFSPRSEGQQESAQAKALRYEYATSWSMNAEEFVSEFIPNFTGTNATKMTETGESQPTYWGKNAFKDNSEYIGMMPIFLGLLAIIFVRNRYTWFFMGLAVFAIVYAMGGSTPFFKIFYYLIPNVKQLRAPSMIMFIFSFSACLLAGFGVHYIQTKLQNASDERKKKIYLYSGIVTAIYIFLAFIFTVGGKGIMKAFKSVFNPAGPQAILEYRAYPNLADVVIGLWILAVIFVLTYFLIKAYSRRTVGLWGLAILAFFAIADSWRMDLKFITAVDQQEYFGKKNVVNLVQDTDKAYVDRVLDADRGILRNSNYFAYFEIPMMFGYHGNQMKIYDEYWNRVGKSNDHSFIFRVENDQKQRGLGHLNYMNMPFIGMAGVKYLVTDYMTDPGQYIDSLKMISTENDIKQDGLVLYELPDYFGRARIYHDFVFIPDHDQAIQYLRQNSSEWRNQVVVEENPDIIPNPEADSTGENLQITEYEMNSISMKVKLNSDGIVYLADCYYPAWKAYVDGIKTPVILANTAFRGVTVKAGEHEIVLRYESEIYDICRAITLVSAFFVLLILGINLYIHRKREEKPVE